MYFETGNIGLMRIEVGRERCTLQLGVLITFVVPFGEKDRGW